MIPLFKVSMESNVDSELLKVLHSGWIGQGPKVDEFEREIAKRIDNPLCLSLSSGTHGITLALRLIDMKRGIKGGGSVVTTPLTCFATHAPVLDNGAEIIFADIKDDLNIDPDSVRERIRGDTKAILFVHWGGYPADLEELRSISQEYNIPLIEDAAHAFGSTYKSYPIGSCYYSDYGIFSWQAIKNLTCFPPGTRIVKGLFKGSNGGLGTIPIEKIKVGDVVRTYNEYKGRKENQKVTDIFKRNYAGKMITIKLENGNELKMTEDHPVYVIKPGWRGYLPANKIKNGDKVFQYEYQGLFFRLHGISQRGKKVEELFGEEKGLAIRERHSELTRGESHFNYGKHLTDEWKKKIGEGNRGKKLNALQRKACSIARKREWAKIKGNPELYSKIRENISKAKTPQVRAKTSESLRKFYDNPTNKNRARSNIHRVMKTESYWENYLKNMPLKKSSSEKQLESILEENFPGEYIFNGDGSGGIVLNRFVPDFVNINGKKKVIELFGKYWHNRRAFHEGISLKKHVENRKKRYREIGWDCLIIMENELNHQPSLVSKLQDFSVNPRSRAVSVISITEEDYSGPVYNIETEKNHNYFAYGILVHNCVDGGMIFMNDSYSYEKAKLLRWFGISREGPMRDLRCRENIEYPGYKFHMNDVCATIALENLRGFDKKLKKTRDNAAFYERNLKDVYGVKLIQTEKDRKSSYWLFSLLVEDRTGFARRMGEKLIAISQVHARTDNHTCMQQFKTVLPNMERIDPMYCCIPVGWWVTPEDRQYIVEAIRQGW